MDSSPLRIPWPALALAAVVLLPFLGKAYTVDDPVFLHEAQNLLIDPLHPSAFEIVWSNEHRLRASAFLPGGPAIAYLLLPLALADWQEWAAHLLMLLYFLVTIAGTAALARRVGLSPWAQQAAALLTASAPVALGMAGTVMPDIPATMFSVLGLERLIAWKQQRRWTAGLAAACLLALAVLTRINLLVLLAIAGAYGLRHTLRTALPVMLAVALTAAGLLLTRDPDPSGGTAATAAVWQVRPELSSYHLVALIIAYLTTTPLLVGLLTRQRWHPTPLLWLWLLVPLPIIAYIHFAPKYVLPALPAVAILASHGLDRLAWRRSSLALATVAGTVLGVLILRADAAMAGTGRAAAAELIRPRVEAGERVWFAGHWGFHWYAEAAGAQALAFEPPFPAPGDIVVTSTLDRPHGLPPRLPGTLIERWGNLPVGGQVMSGPAHAGFYSDAWGLLPWSWGPPHGTGFEVWRVEW
jgi:hypothetical protein